MKKWGDDGRMRGGRLASDFQKRLPAGETQHTHDEEKEKRDERVVDAIDKDDGSDEHEENKMMKNGW